MARPHPSPRLGRRTRSAGFLACLVLAVGGCSSGGDSSSSSQPTGPGATKATDGGSPPMASKVTIGSVAGIRTKEKYKKTFRKAVRPLERRAGTAVDGWIDGAFTDGSYPRSSFPDAFTTFTPQAAADARHQKRLMTNWSVRHDISGVTVTKRQISLDVLAPRGKVAAATARVRLAFSTTGKTKQKVTVTGRLFLTRNSRGAWRVFGFDIAKGAK